MEKIFNSEKLNQAIEGIKKDSPKFKIGIDKTGKFQSYCLVRAGNKNFTIILAKTMDNENEFDKEVENLKQYFNAELITEG